MQFLPDELDDDISVEGVSQFEKFALGNWGDDEFDVFLSFGEVSVCFVGTIRFGFLAAANDWSIRRVAGSTMPPFKAAIAVANAIGCGVAVGQLACGKNAVGQ